MRTDHRWLVVFAGNLVFLFAVSQVNHHLTDFPLLGLARGQVYLFLIGLPLAFAALRLALGPAVLTTAVTTLADPAALANDWVRIEVPRTGHVRVLEADADEVEARDGSGRALRLVGPSSSDLRVRLHEGRSPLLRTSEDVQELVFLRAGRVVARRALDLAPNGRVDVGLPPAP